MGLLLKGKTGDSTEERRQPKEGVDAEEDGDYMPALLYPLTPHAFS